MNTEHQLKLKLAWPMFTKSLKYKKKKKNEKIIQLKVSFLLGYNMKAVI